MYVKNKLNATSVSSECSAVMSSINDETLINYCYDILCSQASSCKTFRDIAFAKLQCPKLKRAITLNKHMLFFSVFTRYFTNHPLSDDQDSSF